MFPRLGADGVQVGGIAIGAGTSGDVPLGSATCQQVSPRLREQPVRFSLQHDKGAPPDMVNSLLAAVLWVLPRRHAHIMGTKILC
jgi:hypothetical protein